MDSIRQRQNRDVGSGITSGMDAPWKQSGGIFTFTQSSVFVTFTQRSLAMIFSVVAIGVPLFIILVVLPSAMHRLECTGFVCRLKYYTPSLWITIMFLYNFFVAKYLAPGHPSLAQPVKGSTGQFHMKMSFHEGDDQEPVLYAPSWCTACAQWKPPRSHHCHHCRRCVPRSDGHSPLLGNCIGIRNHGHLLMAYVFAILGLVFSLAVCARLLVDIWPALSSKLYNGIINTLRHESVTNFAGLSLPLFAAKLSTVAAALLFEIREDLLQGFGIPVLIHIVLAITLLVIVLFLAVPSFERARVGILYIETAYPLKEYVQLQQKTYCPLGPGFYDRGWRQNLVDVLGDRWYLRLFFPTAAGGPNMEDVAPVPSEKGAAILRKIYKKVAEAPNGEGIAKSVESLQDLNPSLIEPSPA